MNGELPNAWAQMARDIGEMMALVDLIEIYRDRPDREVYVDRLIERKKIIDARMAQERMG